MKILKLLNATYGKKNVESANIEGIFRCLKKDSLGNIYAIEYIDFTERWSAITDIKTYLEPIVSEDFYSSEGHLQWSFYYYFISESAVISEHWELKKKLEDNDSFARTFVVSETGFEKLQNAIKTIDSTSVKGLESDLYTLWVNELKLNGLHFVFDPELKSYKRPVEDFISNVIPTNNQPKKTAKKTIEATSFNHIQRLILQDFRPLPEIKEYEFGQVVLVSGANATGKTSFLDAIEMSVTGSCSKNETTSQHKITLTDSEGNKYTYPDKPEKYKPRDMAWYKNNMLKGNNLNSNFNRFNYFTSDAAYELKKNDDDDKQSLEKVIADIALGPEVNKLEDQIKGFQKRFLDVKEFYSKELVTYNENLTSRRKELADLKSYNQDPKEFKGKFVDELLNRGWIVDAEADDEIFIGKSATRIEIVESLLRKLDSPSINLRKISKASIDKERERLKALSLRIAGIKKNQYRLQGEINENEVKIKDAQLKVDFLIRLEPYILHQNIESLIGLEKSISELRTTISRNQKIYEDILDLPITEHFVQKHGSLQIGNIESLITSERTRLNELQTDVIAKLKGLESGISKISTLISDIKASSLEYLRVDPDASNCPACGTNFEKSALLTALESAHNNFSSSAIIDELKAQREQYRIQIVGVEFEYMTMERLKEVYLIDSTLADYNLNNLINHSAELSQTITELTARKFNLEIIGSSFDLAGLSESEYTDLLNLWDELADNEISKDAYISFGNAIQKEYQRLVKRTEKLKEKVIGYGTELGACYTVKLPDDRSLSVELFEIEQSYNSFRQLIQNLFVPDNKSVNDFLNDLSYVRAAHGLYKNSFYEAKRIEGSSTSISTAIEKLLITIEETEKYQKRAIFGDEALTNLLLKYNKNEFLSDYITNNRKEIVNIFNLIHSPKEFSDILFVDDKIKLVGPKDTRALDSISTGQRSALALSVFLSLNKKLEAGPNILMFDDPIAYVDDLNILSFLDYLRELVLRSKKQVIFVTANNDLAFLFRMKFKFLPNEQLTNLHFQRTKSENLYANMA
jgi:exonuclease SbcC